MHNTQAVLRFTLAFTLILPATLAAQTANSATIAGKVLDESGAPLRAIVTATSGAFVQRAFSGGDGSFQFTKLPAGSFYLCAQVPGTMVSLFVDACAARDLRLPAYRWPPVKRKRPSSL